VDLTVLVNVLFINLNDLVLINLFLYNLLYRDINNSLDRNLFNLLDVYIFLNYFFNWYFYHFLERDLDNFLNRFLHEDFGYDISLRNFFDWFFDDNIIRNLNFLINRHWIFNDYIVGLLYKDFLENRFLLSDLNISSFTNVLDTWSHFSLREFILMHSYLILIMSFSVNFVILTHIG